MNINLGTPYEATIRKIIEKGYAGNQSEVIRQALVAYEHMLEEEEIMLVHRAAEIELDQIEADKAETFSFQEIKKILKG